MSRQTAYRAAVGVVIGCALTAQARADIHFWVGGLIDWWDDDGMWSSSINGAGGHGVPQGNDVARAYHGNPNITQTILYRNSDGFFTNLLQVDISGTGTGASGHVNLVMNQSVLKAGTMVFGRFGNTTVLHTGGWIDATDWIEFGSNYNATTYDIDGAAILTAGTLTVGSNGGATVNQFDGIVSVGDLEVATADNCIGNYFLTGGDVEVTDEMTIGYRNSGIPGAGINTFGLFDQDGGDVEVGDKLVLGREQDGEYILRDGTLGVGGRISFGDAFDDDGGVGRFRQTGGVVTAPLVRFFEPTPGYEHVLTVEGGMFTVDQILVDGSNSRVVIDGGDVTVTALLDVNEPAVIDINGGDLEINRIDLDSAGASLSFAGATLISDLIEVDAPGSSWTMISGSVTANDTSVNGSFMMGSGSFTTAHFEVSAVVEITGGALTAGTVEVDPSSNSTVTVGGAGRLYADTIENSKDFRIETGGTIDSVPGRGTRGIFTNTASGRFQYAGGALYHDLVNDGQILTWANFACRGRIINNADMALTHDVISRSDLFENSGDLALDGHAVGCDNGPVRNVQNGSLIGPGAVDGDLVNQGFINVATLDVDGDMTTTGKLLFVVHDAGSADEMIVGGRATIGGILSLDFGGYQPRYGDNWTIITADQVAGAFATVQILSSNPTFDIRVTKTSTRVVAEVIPLPCDGDVDGDRDVDFSDLEILLDNWGVIGTGIPGDLNDSGRVDFADLNILLDHWGDVCP